MHNQAAISQLSSNVAPSQPNTPVVWMKPVEPIIDCPTGLQYFSQLNKIFVQQEINLSNVIGYGSKNRYLVRNSNGEQVFTAAENSSVVSGYDSSRGFIIDLFDAKNNAIMRVIREDKCCVGCFLCITCCKSCAHEVVVQSPVGQTLGYIRQSKNGCNSHFNVLDANQNLILHIKPPFVFNATGQVEFKIIGTDGHTDVGMIYKVFSGYLQEFHTNADNFVVQLTTTREPKEKALLVAATFLIDFMYFENRPEYRRRAY